MKDSAPHLRAATGVPAGPVEELDVSLVERAARSESLVAITLDLSRPQTGKPNLGRDDEEDDQVELGE